MKYCFHDAVSNVGGEEPTSLVTPDPRDLRHAGDIYCTINSRGQLMGQRTETKTEE